MDVYYDNLKCPYCGAEQTVTKFHGLDTEKDILYSSQCLECGKEFVFYVNITYGFEAFKQKYIKF